MSTMQTTLKQVESNTENTRTHTYTYTDTDTSTVVEMKASAGTGSESGSSSCSSSRTNRDGRMGRQEIGQLHRLVELLFHRTTWARANPEAEPSEWPYATADGLSLDHSHIDELDTRPDLSEYAAADVNPLDFIAERRDMTDAVMSLARVTTEGMETGDSASFSSQCGQKVLIDGSP